MVYSLHLFAGCGGGILADAILGNVPVGAVEINSAARSVLFARQADQTLPPFPIWDDVRTFSGSNPRGRWAPQSRLGRMADGFSDWLDAVVKGDWWTPDEQKIPRLAEGVFARVHRLKMLGNAQVPLCAAVAFSVLHNVLLATFRTGEKDYEKI